MNSYDGTYDFGHEIAPLIICGILLAAIYYLIRFIRKNKK